MPHRTYPVVSRFGATAGSVLRGVGLNNHGLRLRIAVDQPPGRMGSLYGRFVLLEPGDSVHAPSLGPLVGRETDADEVLSLIRKTRPASVNVANANSMIVEAAH